MSTHLQMQINGICNKTSREFPRSVAFATQLRVLKHHAKNTGEAEIPDERYGFDAVRTSRERCAFRFQLTTTNQPFTSRAVGRTLRVSPLLRWLPQAPRRCGRDVRSWLKGE